MNTFTLLLNSAIRTETIPSIISFVGADASGSFGLQSGHTPLITLLAYGLSRFQNDTEQWFYLACPGALLHFELNQLTINTRHYLVHADHEKIAGLLAGQLAEEEAGLQSIRHNLQQLEQALFRRLRLLERG